MSLNWFWIGFFLILSGKWYCNCCLEKERNALLQVKLLLNNTLALQTWLDDEDSSDCCQWERVICSSTNGRVTELYLNNTSEKIYLDEIDLNNSFLQNIEMMTSLRVLSVSGCGLTGKLPDVGGLCELINIEMLDLSSNSIQGNLPNCFIDLTSLQTLDISSNQFTGDISISPLKSLYSLVYLDLSYNHFQIPFSLGLFFNHSKFKHIKALGNEIYLEPETHSTPKFQLISIVFSGYGNCGGFPDFLYYQHGLKIINLSHLALKGEFPNWLLSNNTRLEELYLANNSLSGNFQVPVQPLVVLSALDISNNFIQSQIPIEIGKYFPNLKFLNMSKNSFNGSIPSSFGKMNSLLMLDLSSNQLSGNIPEHLAIGCFSLYSLILSNNNLQGEIFSEGFNLTNLWWLKLDGNHFIGSIPEQLPSSLSILDLSDNYFIGKIPSSMGNLTYIQHLVMSNNYLDGPIPPQFCLFQYLEVLDLSVNNLSGTLPSCFCPPTMIHLHLSDNNIEGPWTNALSNSQFMVTLDLSNNRITGRIPNHIGGLKELRFLILKMNNFDGEIPYLICELYRLSLIDLSYNNLIGSIPYCLHLDQSENADLSPIAYPMPNPINNPFYQPIRPMTFTIKRRTYPYYGKILSYLSGIDLSHNKLTGKIPPEIGNLTVIRSLNLSYNNFTGPVPLTFSNLKQIESLDLSYNSLNGEIPSQLVALNFLSSFSVAYNNLSGKTPERSGQFATFEVSSYEGNPNLCGLPLLKSCAESESSAISRALEVDEENSVVDMETFYASFVVSYMVFVLVIFLVLYLNPCWRRALFEFVEICYYFIVDKM